MASSNPYQFIDPRLIKFPANKDISCADQKIGDHHQPKPQMSYFNNDANRTPPPLSWAYDNFFGGQNVPFDATERRADRTNIERRFAAIHKEEVGKRVPSCTQSWYGHRVAKYDQRLTDREYGRCFAIAALRGPNGWPYAKKDTVNGRSEADANRTLIDVVKPIL